MQPSKLGLLQLFVDPLRPSITRTPTWLSAPLGTRTMVPTEPLLHCTVSAEDEVLSSPGMPTAIATPLACTTEQSTLVDISRTIEVASRQLDSVESASAMVSSEGSRLLICAHDTLMAWARQNRSRLGVTRSTTRLPPVAWPRFISGAS